ncbi:MAG: pentapeptide repeat-containing protein [Bdellovibrionales bacterium]
MSDRFRYNFLKKHNDAVNWILFLNERYVLTDGKEGVRLNLTSRSLRGAKFVNADLSHGEFSFASFNYSDFREAKLLKVKLRGANIWDPEHGLTFERETKNRYSLTQASNEVCLAPDRTIACAKYHHLLNWIVDLNDAYATSFGAQGIRLDLSEKTIRRACFLGTDLSHGDFRGAKMLCVDLIGAKMSPVNLKNADIWAPIDRIDLPQRSTSTVIRAVAAENDMEYCLC